MKEICIYCGLHESHRKGDHVPPQKFFMTPRGFPLIQVPCCIGCNIAFSADDERMRNLLIAIDSVEEHPAVVLQLRDASKRSLVKQKKKGGVTTRNLDHLRSNTRMRDRYSESGIYLGQAPASSASFF